MLRSWGIWRQFCSVYWPPHFQGCILAPNRRPILTATALPLFARHVLGQAQASGTTVSLAGQAVLGREGSETDLHAADPLMEGDSVTVAAGSTAMLELFTATPLNLGAGQIPLVGRWCLTGPRICPSRT